MKEYPRGSEWRKWDLHLHTPTSPDYKDKSATNVQIIQALEKSGIDAAVITDHNFIDVDRIKDLQIEGKKKSIVIFPGIELRGEYGKEPINYIGIFSENADLTYIRDEMYSKLDLTKKRKEGRTEDELYCPIENGSKIIHSLGGIVSIHAGRKSNSIECIPNTLPSSMAQKKDIASCVDIFELGSVKDAEDYLNTVFKKLKKLYPMVVASDSHDCKSYGFKQDNYCWIKANPTFEGLLQTLIEPDERVCISPIKPDTKEPYKVIESIKFSGTNDFPPEKVVFNENLASIIGSRSSGKSALLAYIAHTINNEETVERQLASQEGIRSEDIGPAAGVTWASVASIKCEVKWASGTSGGGKVVYIPQNYLYSISNRPAEITQKVVPVLFKNFPDVKSQYEKTSSDIEAANLNIENAVNKWFDGQVLINRLSEDIKEIGDKEEIQKARDAYQAQINELKKQLSITDKDIAAYQALTQDISTKEVRKKEIVDERNSVLPFVTVTQDSVEAVSLGVTVAFYPSINSLPTRLGEKINEKVVPIQIKAEKEAQGQILSYYDGLNKEEGELAASIARIQADNSELIEKNKQNNELAGLVGNVNKQNAKLTSISEKETLIKEKIDQLITYAGVISDNISSRTQTLTDLSDEVFGLDQSSYEITFGVEFDYDRQTSLALADKFNRSFISPYIIDGEGGLINMPAVRDDVSNFLKAMESGTQKLKSNQDKKQTTKDVLCAAEEIRFSATLEDDKIGGFALSSMTPGKRALFALTLILSETEGGWPLLIDQPEDDLDSRSIYEQIVPYIMQRKKERQIIMVSHNANLVVGADAEQVIVANKHGDDRKNRNSMTFDYLTGSLEDSTPKNTATCVLDTCGIREHACEILDGGEEAFEKRKDKYRL